MNFFQFLRPRLDNLDGVSHDCVRRCLQECWQEDPLDRPDVKVTLFSFITIFPSSSKTSFPYLPSYFLLFLNHDLPSSAPEATDFYRSRSREEGGLVVIVGALLPPSPLLLPASAVYI